MSDKKVSLSEVNQSIATPKNAGFFRTLLAFSGPGMLVAVGYMDPGNWITSVVGGATKQDIERLEDKLDQLLKGFSKTEE